MNPEVPNGENVESFDLWRQRKAEAPAQGDALIAELGQMNNSEKIVALESLFTQLEADNKNRFVGEYISLEREKLVEEEKKKHAEENQRRITEAQERMKVAA